MAELVDAKAELRQRLELLNGLWAAMESVGDLQSLGAEMLQIVSTATQARRALILFQQPEQGRALIRLAESGFAPKELTALSNSLATDSPLAEALEEGQARIINAPGAARGLLPAVAARQALQVPLRLRGRTHGLLVLLDRRQGLFTSQDLELARLTAPPLSALCALEESWRLADALREANQGWRELLAQVSHELRMPLTPILTWTQILGRQARLERRWQKAVEVIQRNTRAQARLIDDLLDVTGLGPKGGLRPHRVDLSEQIRLAAEAVRPQADAHRVSIRVELPKLAQVVHADPHGVQQVVAHLLRNAVRSAPGGGFIALSGAAEQDSIRLTVTVPHGAGSKPDTVRADHDKPPTTAAGMGVGLALIKQLVERHGGTIRASRVEQATAFEVVLPASAAPALPDPESEAGSHLAGAEVLVIEDHDDSREALVALLDAQGAHVRAAASGEEGITLALAGPPRVVLCDLAMPGLSGYDVARRLRREPGWGQVPLLALTAHGSAEDIARAQGAGFSAHLLKPVDAGQLLDVIVATAQA